MTTSARTSPVATSRAKTDGPRLVLLWLAVLNTAGALAGAWGLASGAISLSETANNRLPWDSPVFGGVALALVVALPNCALAIVALRRSPYTGLVGIAVGAGMVGWIMVQLAFIREFSFFHPLYIAIGLVMVWAGFREMRIDRADSPVDVVDPAHG